MAARNRIDLLGGTAAKPSERLAAHERGATSTDPRVRADAARGLALLAKTGAVPAVRAVKRIAPLIADPDLEVRLVAAGALASLDAVAWAPKLHAIVLEALRQEEIPDALPRATGQLVAFGDAALTSSLRGAAEAIVRDAPGSPRVDAAASVLGALASAGDRDALRPLIAVLSDPLRANQQTAALMLGRIRLPAAAEALKRWRAQWAKVNK